jgi:hypothetical protein
MGVKPKAERDGALYFREESEVGGLGRFGMWGRLGGL